ncbi:HAD-IIB family hydrolase [Bacillus sp. PK6-026]
MNFVFDLDGTICFKGRPVSEKLLKPLEQLASQGHKVIFASARPIRDLLPVLHERFHHYSMIGGNGSMVAADGKIISTASFDEQTFSDIVRLLEDYRMTYLIDSDWDYAYTGPATHPILNNLDPHKLAKNIEIAELRNIVKILLLTSTNMKEAEERLAKIDVVVHVHGNEEILDISPKGVDKWHGLQKLGIKKDEFIAFGNDANDIPMFKHALYSIMVGQHSRLGTYASESLPLDDNIEYALIQKFEELEHLYTR